MIRPQIPAIACLLLCQTFVAFADDLPPAVERKIDFVQDVQPLLKTAAGRVMPEKSRSPDFASTAAI